MLDILQNYKTDEGFASELAGEYRGFFLTELTGPKRKRLFCEKIATERAADNSGLVEGCIRTAQFYMGV